MIRILNLAILSALVLPLSAQRTQPFDSTNPAKAIEDSKQWEPVPATPFVVHLTVDQDRRVATMTSEKGVPFFGFMIASTKLGTFDIAGVGSLLAYEMIVATLLCKDGKMVLDLGTGGWGYDVYLQGVA